MRESILVSLGETIVNSVVVSAPHTPKVARLLLIRNGTPKATMEKELAAGMVYSMLSLDGLNQASH